MGQSNNSLGLLIAVVGFTVAGLVSMSLASLRPLAPKLPVYDQLGMDFNLESTQEFNSLSSVKGRVALLSFGFTSCTDICPMMMSKYAQLYKELDANNLSDQVTFFFVTVDPERDTLERMQNYIQQFDERIIGLRGSASEIDQLQESLAVLSQTLPGSHEISHSDRIFLFDTEGQLRAMPNLTDPVNELALMVEGLTDRD